MNLPKIEHVDGKVTTPHLLVLTLSTCGFCKRAMLFLENHGFAYDYLHLDQIPLEEKSRIKEQFKEKFGVSLAFPTLILDDKEVVIGFIEAKWQDRLGVK